MRGKWAIFIAVLFSLLFVAGVGTMLAMGNRAGSGTDAPDTETQGSAAALTGDTAERNTADGLIAGKTTADSDLTDSANPDTADVDSANADSMSADQTDEGSEGAKGDAAPGQPDNGSSPEGDFAGQPAPVSKEDVGDKAPLSQEESDRINLELARRLRASYDKIVVLDPGHGGTDSGLVVASSDDPETNLAEKDLSLQVALKVKEILEGKQICVILTRDTDMTLGESSRVLIANGMPADLFISLHVRSDADTTLHGMSAVYNASFYSPRIQNAQLAYDLLKNMEDVTKEKSLGMFDADRDADIMSLMIPSVELSLGQLSNAQDVKLLMRGDYQDKLALGIADGILASFTRMDESKNQ